ncbi:MAG: helix-turn-helix transcriptional regulator [Clostridia bacterium]|nr:helix-turn-helix transcriptional regulator [Clostridia bacterium]
MKIKYINSKAELAENIQLYRKKLNLTQINIAKALKIDRSTYSCYESGKTSPSIFTLIKLSKIFNVNVTKLVSKKGK